MFIKSDQKILAGAELTEFISYQRTFVCPVHFVLDNITCFLMAMKNNWLSKMNGVDPDGGGEKKSTVPSCVQVLCGVLDLCHRWACQQTVKKSKGRNQQLLSETFSCFTYTHRHARTHAHTHTHTHEHKHTLYSESILLVY